MRSQLLLVSFKITLFRDCIEGVLGNDRMCPKCQLPAILKNLTKNPFYETIVNITKQLIDSLPPMHITTTPEKENIASKQPVKKKVKCATEKKPKKEKAADLTFSAPAKKTKKTVEALEYDSSAMHTPCKITQSSQPRKRSLVISSTGLTNDEKELLWSSAFSISKDSCNVVLLDDFDSSATHLITSSNERKIAPRTLKYLHGILEGKWIVKFECKNCFYFQGF